METRRDAHAAQDAAFPVLAEDHRHAGQPQAGQHDRDPTAAMYSVPI